MVVVAYGITSRVAQRAIDMARAKGLQGRHVPADHGVALPGETDSRTGGAGKAFVVPEMNLGQMVHEVERAAGGKAQDRSLWRTAAAGCTIRKKF